MLGLSANLVEYNCPFLPPSVHKSINAALKGNQLKLDSVCHLSFVTLEFWCIF